MQRTFAPASPHYENATKPFDPTKNGSFHATHVAGIAAGDHATPDGAVTLSGVAPNAYLGNYKALTIPTPGFGLDGNSAEIAAGIEAAVADGMDVINLSLGEPEVEPSRDLVVHAIEGAARAGVVPVIAAGNDFDQFGYGSISSPANAPDAITVAATTESGTIADFSSAGPTPVSLQLKPDVSAPGVSITSSLPANQNGRTASSRARAWRRLTWPAAWRCSRSGIRPGRSPRSSRRSSRPATPSTPRTAARPRCSARAEA